jgi:DNA repair exonuclease SbcCD ATPase subunit
MQFDSMYCYGGNNFVDFTTMEYCITGMIAPNHSGKSALIDILLYALYNEYPRAPTKGDIKNKQEKAYYVILNFELNGIAGTIRKGSSMGCKFYYNNEDMTCPTIPATVKRIAHYIGSFDAAMYIAITSQTPYVEPFLDLTTLKRRTLFANLFGLDVFRKIEKDVASEILATKKKMANIEGRIREYPDISEEITKKQAEIDSMQEDVGEYDTNFWTFISHIATNVSNVPELSDKLSNKRYEIEETKRIATLYNDTLEDITFLSRPIEEILAADDHDRPCVNPHNVNHRNDMHVNPYTGIYSSDEIHVPARLKNFIKKIKTPPCSVEQSTKLVQRILIDKKTALEAFDSAEAIQYTYREAIREYNVLKSDLELYSKFDYDSIMTKMRSNAGSRDSCIMSIAKLRGEIHSLTKRLDMIDEDRREHASFSARLLVLEQYLSLVKPTGALYNEMLSPVLKMLENGMNVVLRYIGSNMVVRISDDCGIAYMTVTPGMNHGSIQYAQESARMVNVSLASGYQRFIIDFAFRTTMFEITDITLPNCCIIDEGFAACDSAHLDDILRYVETLSCSRLQCAPMLTIIVSHLTTLRMRSCKSFKIYVNPDNRQSRIMNAIPIDKPLPTDIHKSSDVGPDHTQDDAADKFHCAACNRTVGIKYKNRHLQSKGHMDKAG